MGYIHVDIVDIRDECDGGCAHGRHLTDMQEKAIALLAHGDVAGAISLLSTQHPAALAKAMDPMEKAFVEWQKLPLKDRHAFWDDTHGKRHCA